MAAPMDLAIMRVDGAMMLDTPINYNVEWEEFWKTISLAMLASYSKAQESRGETRLFSIYGGKESTGMSVAGIRSMLRLDRNIGPKIKWLAAMDVNLYGWLRDGDMHGPVNIPVPISEADLELGRPWLHRFIKHLPFGIQSTTFKNMWRAMDSDRPEPTWHLVGSDTGAVRVICLSSFRSNHHM